MSIKRHPEEALLFFGTLFSSPDVYDKVLPFALEKFGPLLFESETIPWDLSTYYRDELGVPISRRFIFFERTIDASLLPEIKLLTDDIESRNIAEGRRRINIDPGYLTEAKVILASTKNYSHRIYLGRGVYAEQEYIFSRGSYRPLSHAYPDYCKPEYLKLFLKARQNFRQLIAKRSAVI